MENYTRSKLQVRRGALENESGFTLVELIVVMVIIGVLLGIAVQALSFEKKAQQTAAMADVRNAIADAEAYYVDHSSYGGMNAATLKSTYDSGLVVSVSSSPGVVTAVPLSTDSQKYCISGVDQGHWAHVNGPGGQVVNDDNDSPAATSDPCAGA